MFFVLFLLINCNFIAPDMDFEKYSIKFVEHFNNYMHDFVNYTGHNLRLLKDSNNKVVYEYFLNELKITEMKLDNLNFVFYEFFKLIEVRIMNIDDYYLNEDLYPIFVFLDFIAHDFFSD